MPEHDIEGTMQKYENFIEDVLKQDLRRLELQLAQTNIELADLLQQKHTLMVINDKSMHPDGFKTQLNIGCNFFMEASVPDTSKLLMNIGLNHHLEFTVEEAVKVLDTRIQALEKKVALIKTKVAEIQAHIKLMLMGMAQLEEHSYKDIKYSMGTKSSEKNIQ